MGLATLASRKKTPQNSNALFNFSKMSYITVSEFCGFLSWIFWVSKLNFGLLNGLFSTSPEFSKNSILIFLTLRVKSTFAPRSTSTSKKRYKSGIRYSYMQFFWHVRCEFAFWQSKCRFWRVFCSKGHLPIQFILFFFLSNISPNCSNFNNYVILEYIFYVRTKLIF